MTREEADARIESAKTARRANLEAAAALNDQLPDDDPRKITRDLIDLLRGSAEHSDDVETWRMGPLGWRTRLVQFAEALESYLPPPPRS